jgi:hypothetical protein
MSRDDKDQLIDLSDARQIGLLIGLSGGSIVDATEARLALERFEETYARKATTREAGIVVGLMKSMKN